MKKETPKRGPRKKTAGKNNFKFENIIPLSELFPEKLLKEKIRDIKNNPTVRNIGNKVKTSMRFVGDQAVRIGKSARDIAFQTSTQVKIARYNAQINKLYMLIGEEIYEQTKNQSKLPEDKSTIPRSIEKIKNIEADIAKLENQLLK